MTDAQVSTCREWLNVMVGKEVDEQLATQLILLAESKTLMYTNRSYLTDAMLTLVCQWSLIAYNRLGTEGETSRNSGGISSAYAEIPDDLKASLNSIRLARVSGTIHEAAEG